MSIQLKELSFDRMRFWLQKSKESEEEPVYAFITRWIAFNYYYYTFASSNSAEFKNWCTNQNKNPRGDGAKLSFLVASTEFQKILEDSKKSSPKAYQAKVSLPVIDVVTQKPIPENVTGEYQVTTLQASDLFSVMYQIRNNLFHGSKEPEKATRDIELCTFAANILGSLIPHLLENTSGEVRNAYKEALS